MNRLDEQLDALLHLMDRQVVDSDGLLVCKCDDLELVEDPSGELRVTALLVGAPVWVPRLGQWLHVRWQRLGSAQSDRQLPYRLDLRDVAEVSQEIRLKHPRTGVLVRQDATGTTVRRLVGDLLGARVEGPDDEPLGRVLDVRLQPSAGPPSTLLLVGLLVGRGRPGSYLGYDRRDAQGPWLVRRIVRWLHRHSGFVPADAVAGIAWEDGVVRTTASLSPLSGAPG